MFGQNRFLRDRFKNIDYLVAPAGGVGYSVVDTPETKMAFDIGLGGVWEGNAGVPVEASWSLTFGETLVQPLTATTTLTQSFSGLWKTIDLGDSLHVLSIGLSATMSTHTQLKVELLDTYKSAPPLPTVQKNDVAVLVTVVYQM